MIYTDEQLIVKIKDMIIKFEDEVVEFKETRTSYSFKDIGKYFSALGNEANIRGKKEAWLIFGVDNKRNILGTAYRQDGNLQNLKKEIVGGTNERATFMEIYALEIDKHRIIAFQIPPATRGIPTTWNGQQMLEKMNDIEILNKVGLLIKGKVTNTALILSGQQTLFPDETYQYDQDVVKEILNNCIAHSNYQLRGKINVEEFEDRLVFINEGNFIPETVEQALEEGYKPPYYQNTFLFRAMVNLYMIDTNSMGIPMMYQIQREKCFPLPTYDLENPSRVKVTLFGKILDKNYTQLLKSNGDLDLQTVFLLDEVQKHETISKESYNEIKGLGLVEGRYPNIFVSYKVANMVGQQTEYVRNKGLSNEVYKKIIINALETMDRASVNELKQVLIGALPAIMDDKQQSKKVSNILQAMKREGKANVEGTGHAARWYLTEK